LEKIRVPRPGPGHARKRPDSISADKAYASRANRAHPRRQKIRGCIPEKRDQRANRLARGSAGGRAPGFDKELHAKRNTVERAINKLKQFRAVATRYDKRLYIFEGTAAAVMIWLRSLRPTDPPDRT
jgi:transposase